MTLFLPLQIRKKQCTFCGSDFSYKFLLSVREHLRLFQTLEEQLEYTYMYMVQECLLTDTIYLGFNKI